MSLLTLRNKLAGKTLFKGSKTLDVHLSRKRGYIVFKKQFRAQNDFTAFHNILRSMLCISFGTSPNKVEETLKSYNVERFGSNSLVATKDCQDMHFSTNYTYNAISLDSLLSIHTRVTSSRPNLSNRFTELLSSIDQKPYWQCHDDRSTYGTIYYSFDDLTRVCFGFYDNKCREDEDDEYYLDVEIDVGPDAPDHIRPYSYIY